MATFIKFDAYNPKFTPDIQFLEQQYVQQCNQLIMNLVQFAKTGFCFAACDQLTIANDIRKTHLQQVNQTLKQQILTFQKQMCCYKLVQGLPLVIICELLNVINNFQPAVVTYILTLIFPETQIQMERVVEVLVKNKEYLNKYTQQFQQFNITQFLKINPMSYASCNTGSDYKQHITDVNLKLLNSQCTITYQVSPQLYVNALNLCENFLMDLISLLRSVDYLVFDIYSGYCGQLSSENIKPGLMGLLMQYQNVYKTIVSYDVLFQRQYKQMIGNLGQICISQSDSKTQQTLQDEYQTSDNPLVIGVDQRFDENTEILLGLCLTLSSKCPLQTIQGNSLLSTFDISNICYIAQQSYRVIVFNHPENLKQSSLWWLIHSIPYRYIDKQTKSKDNLQKGFATIKNLVADTYTVPIKGQIIFITRTVKNSDPKCPCICKNFNCPNNSDEEEDILNQKGQKQNKLLQQFLNFSVYLDLMCQLGSCKYCNSSELQIKCIQRNTDQNNVIVTHLQKQLKQDIIMYPSLLKSEMQTADILINRVDQSIVSTHANFVQGFFLVVQQKQGLVNYMGTEAIAICLSLNNTKSYASALMCLYYLTINNQIYSRSRLLFHGKLIQNRQVQEFKQYEFSIKNVIGTSMAQLYLSANPICYNQIQQLIQQENTNYQEGMQFDFQCQQYVQQHQHFKHIVKRTSYINVLMLIVYKLLDKQQYTDFYQQVDITQKANILFTITFNQMFNNIINKNIEVKLQLHFLNLISQLVQPLFGDYCSNDSENIFKLKQLFQLADQYQLISNDYCVNDCLSIQSNGQLATTQKGKYLVDIDSQKILPFKSNINIKTSNIPQFFLNLTNNQLDNDLHIIDDILKNQNTDKLKHHWYLGVVLYLFQNKSQNQYNKESDMVSNILLNQLKIDSILPWQSVNFDLQKQQKQNILSILLMCKITQNSDIMYQTYDTVMRLYLKVLAQNKFKDQKTNCTNQKVSVYYDIFQDQYFTFAFNNVSNNLQLCCKIINIMQNSFFVPIKPTDLYLFKNSDKTIHHGKELLINYCNDDQYQFDLYTALPDINNISDNCQQLINIYDVQQNDYFEVFRLQYGPLFCDNLLQRISQLFEENKQLFQQLQFLNIDQVKLIIFQQLSSKIYINDKLQSYEKLQKLQGSYVQFMLINHQDVSLSVNKQFIIQQDVNEQNDDFIIVSANFQTEPNIFDMQYIQSKFMPYFNYLLNISVDAICSLKIQQMYQQLFIKIQHTNLLLFDIVNQLLILWCQFVRECLLDQFTNNQIQAKEKLIDEIVTNFYYMIIKLFGINESDQQTQFSPLYGMIINQCILKQQHDILNRVSIEVLVEHLNCLQTTDYYELSCWLLGIIMCIICNIKIVFCSLDDMDFICDIFKVNFDKQIIEIENICDSCRKQENQIQKSIFNGDLIYKYKYLLPKSIYKHKLNIYCTNNNCILCQNCISDFYCKQMQQCVIIQKFNTNALIRIRFPTVKQQICLSLMQIKILLHFLNENKQSINDPDTCIQLYTNEKNVAQNIEFIKQLQKQTNKQITIEDQYQILVQVLKRQNKDVGQSQINYYQLQLRNKAILSKLSPKFIFIFLLQFIEKNDINQIFYQVCDYIVQQNNTILYQIALFLISQAHSSQNNQFKIKNPIQSEKIIGTSIINTENIIQNIEYVYQLYNQNFDCIQLSFTDISNIIKQNLCWQYEVSQNSNSIFVQGSRIKVLFINTQDEIQQMKVVNEIYQNLNDAFQKTWQIIHSSNEILEQSHNYIIANPGNLNLNQILDQLINFTTQNICIIYFKECQIHQQDVLKYLYNICFYYCKEVVCQFKQEDKLIKFQLFKWLTKDQQSWLQLQFTQSHLFTQQQNQKQLLQQFSQNQNTMQIIDKMFQYTSNYKITDISYQLYKKFTNIFIQHFIQLLHTIQTNNDIIGWYSQYGAEQYISNISLTILEKIIQSDINQLQQISKTYLNYKNSQVKQLDFQTIKPNVVQKSQLVGVEPQISSFVTQYVLQKPLTPQESIKYKVLNYHDTHKIPQALPITNFSFILCQVLIQYSKQIQNEKYINQLVPKDIANNQFNILVYILSTTPRIYQFSQISNFFIEHLDDVRIDSTKLQSTADLCVLIISKVICKQDNIENVSQEKLLQFVLENYNFCWFIASLLNSLFKSDLLHYVQSYIFTAIQLTKSLEELHNKIHKQLLQFSLDCFSKNLSYCAYYLYFSIINFKTYDYQYFLIVTYFYILFKNNTEAQLEETCLPQKDQQVLQQFKLIYESIQNKVSNQQQISIVLDIFDHKYVNNNQYIVNKLTKHFICNGQFSMNDDIAIQELCWFLQHPCLKNYNPILYIFQQQRKQLHIFDINQIFSVQLKSKLTITNMQQLQQLLQWYQQFMTNQVQEMNFEQSQNIVMSLLSYTRQLTKFPFNFNIEQINLNNKHNSDHSNLFKEQIMEKHLVQQLSYTINTIVAQYLVNQLLQNNDLIYIKPLLSKPHEQIQFLFYEHLKHVITPVTAQFIILNNETVNQLFVQIHQICKQNQINQATQELPEYSKIHINNTPSYYELRSNQQYSNLVGISGQAQKFMIQTENKQIPANLKKQIEDIGGRYIQNIKRIQFLNKYQNTNMIIKLILVSTEAFLLDVGLDTCFHQLLADNHDECLGLWMPSHVFESRLGIVHADCGLKDTRFESVNTQNVQVRLLTPIATRLSWILTFSCIFMSLKINPQTMETSQEQSILSDEEQLCLSRDQYCVGVISTCLSILVQIKQCYEYEALIIYQQFLHNYATLLKKNQQQNLLAPKQTQTRDQIELLLQEASSQAEIQVIEIVKRCDKSSKQLIISQNIRVVDKNIDQESVILQFLQITQLPSNVTNIINAIGYGTVLRSRLRKCIINKIFKIDIEFEDIIKMSQQENESATECEKYIQKYLQETVFYFKSFQNFYNKCYKLITIGGGCQDTLLPELQQNPNVQQLIRLQDYSEYSNDLSILDEFITAGSQVVQSQSLPHMFLFDELDVIEVQPQFYLM